MLDTNFARALHLDGLLTFASYGCIDRGEGAERVASFDRSEGGANFIGYCAKHGLGTSVLIAQPTGMISRTLTPQDIASSLHIGVYLQGGLHVAKANIADLPEPTILLDAGNDVFAVWRLKDPIAGKVLFPLSEAVAAKASGKSALFVPLPGTLRKGIRVEERQFLKHLTYSVDDLSGATVQVKPLTRGDQIPVTPKDWLWPDMIAARKMLVLMGPPGVGKSTIAMDIAARVTTGRDWPDGSINSTVGDVAFLEAEDDQEEDSRPRAEAAGADMSRINIVDEARNLSTAAGIASLERELDRMDNPRLIVLSPYRSYFGGKDNKETNNEVEIRRRLKPMMDLAKARRCAVICIGHKKPGSSGRSAEDAAGPQAYGKALRAMITAAEDTTDPVFKQNPKHARRVLFSAKANNGGDGFELLYKTQIVRISSGEVTSRIEWLGLRETTCPELLALPAPGARETAMEWLREFLSRGPKPAAEIVAAAVRAGHSRPTLYRAREQLGVLGGREEFQGTALWRLP